MSAPAAVKKAGIALVPQPNRMAKRLPQDPFLLARFEEFYAEVVKVKMDIRQRALLTSAREAQQQLAAVLAMQESEARRICTLLGVEMYRQAQRVMACLADEVFGAFAFRDGDWPSLEAEMFEVNGAPGFSPGAQCQRKLKQLLEQNDPVYRELATIYFYAIALGRRSDEGAENDLEALSKMISEPVNDSGLFAQSYAHTLADNKLTFLPSATKWLVPLGAIVFTWLVFSWMLWMEISEPIKTQLQEIRRLLRP